MSQKNELRTACFAAVLTVVWSIAPVHAQELSGSGLHKASIEIDPMPFALGGYSVAGGMRVSNHMRVSVNAFAYDLPSFQVEDGWKGRVTSGVSGRLQYYFRDTARGAFVAIQAGPVHSRYTREGVAGSAELTQLQVTPSAGYRWFPRNGHFYLMPAAGFGIAPSADVSIGGSKHRTKSLAPIAALHVGWEF